jgi:catechol 2,3-dioxygenase-like lactoylglutathione lyase family enzyme
MIRHVAGIAEIVEDVQAAVAFYRDVLGLDVEQDEGSAADYAVVKVPGVAHFGLWSRESAAESTYGDRAAAARVPLGISVGFEVESVDEAAARLRTVRAPQDEPWGQRTARFVLPSGALSEVCETPGARDLPATADAASPS